MLRIKHINGNPEFTRGTIAVNLPTKEHLQHIQNEFLSATYLKVAATFVHPKEQYKKSIGRTNAEKEALEQESKYCLLKSVEPRENRWVYHFLALVPDHRPGNRYIQIEFGVAVCKNSEHTGLEYATFRE